MEKVCIYCTRKFKSHDFLKNHVRDSNHCKLLRGLIFRCKTCGTTSGAISDMEKHDCNQEVQNITCIDPIEDMKKKISNYEKDYADLKSRHDAFVAKSGAMKIAFQLEQMKVSVLTDLILQKTDIDPSNLFTWKDDTFHILDHRTEVEIVVHNEQKNTSKSRKISVKTCKKKGQTWRKLNNVTRNPPESDKTDQKVLDVDAKMEKIIYDNFDVSQKEIDQLLNGLWEEVKTNRIYKTHICNIQKLSNKLLGKLDLTEYVDLISSHVEKLNIIFKEKGQTKSKIKKITNTMLSSLDKRFLLHGDYIDSTMDPDEIERLGLAIQINAPHKKCWSPINTTKSVNGMLHYSIALYPLTTHLSWFLFNCYGFNNLIYLSPESDDNLSDPNDLFTFYSLDKVRDGIRYWKMECRLEDITNKIVATLQSHCVNLFKTIYRDVFQDNVYREDYKTQSYITEYDCEQLLHNIIALSKPVAFNRTLRRLVRQKASYSATTVDKFNLTSNDKLQSTRMKNMKDSEDETVKTLMVLFDGLTLKQGRDFLTQNGFF